MAIYNAENLSEEWLIGNVEIIVLQGRMNHHKTLFHTNEKSSSLIHC